MSMGELHIKLFTESKALWQIGLHTKEVFLHKSEVKGNKFGQASLGNYYHFSEPTTSYSILEVRSYSVAQHNLMVGTAHVQFREPLYFRHTTAIVKGCWMCVNKAELEGPLRTIIPTKAGNAVQLAWTPEAEKAFVELKQALQSLPALGFPDPNKPFTQTMLGRGPQPLVTTQEEEEDTAHSNQRGVGYEYLVGLPKPRKRTATGFRLHDGLSLGGLRCVGCSPSLHIWIQGVHAPHHVLQS
ncbi:hypothetical protein P4O66_001146 [Electrophorus voltai]|uniref:Uncharacterized protein n=1 Tax=Electrophorus voltai TaxID=2609070 RepID=A0AAD8ZAY7_9TELE|nr:hypothetical protein P4O66_001146 [Electrophorus voltai]